MGLYDYVRCHYELPEHPEFQYRLFQTKDLDEEPALRLFIISRQGKLIEMQQEYEYGENGELATTSYSEVGIFDFTGECFFYDFASEHYRWDTGKSGWIEFKAVFTHGRLDTIEVHSYEPVEGGGCDGKEDRSTGSQGAD